MAGLIYKELWHDAKTCEWSARWSSDLGWLWVKLISFVEDHASRGFVTELQAITVAALNHIPQTAIAQLVEAHGLDQLEDGRYRIHNYAQRGKLSRVRAEAGRKGGQTTQANLSSKPSSKFAQANALANSGVGVGVVERIYEKWSESVGRVVRLTPGRRKAIIVRLKDGFTEEDLLDAAEGWQNDPWPDRPQHNDLTILFRNGEQVEKFRDLQRSGRPVVASKNPAMTAGRDWLDVAERMKAAGR